MKLLLTLAIAACVVLTNGKSVIGPQKDGSTRAEIFRADFRGSLSAAFDGAGVSYGNQNVVMWGSNNGADINGIDVTYPAGSYKPSGPIVGGFGVHTNHAVTSTAVFRYSVFFPSGFNFVKGGKLPGMYGGKKSCTGGDPAYDCFSTRLMWRDSGKGELYLYANREAQDPSICQQPGNYCNPEFGWSLNTGAFTFKTGVWTQVEEKVTLNTPGQRNGVLAIRINGAEVIRCDNIVFRIADFPNMKVEGLDVETFFGGGSADWATPTTQIVKFKDFVLSTE